MNDYYDPRIRQPATLGELATWFIAQENHDRSRYDVPAPIRLNPPLDPPLDRLNGYCEFHFGGHISYENVRRLIGKYVLDAGVSGEEAESVPLTAVADLLAPVPAKAEDFQFMQLAIEQAKLSKNERPDDPKVGVVVVKDGKILATAFRGERGTGEHAEYTALERKLDNVAIAGATVYSTLEPCTCRNHPKVPCARRLIERQVTMVWYGMLDPDSRIRGLGERLLRKHGVAVERFPHELVMQIEEFNRDFVRARENALTTGANELDAERAGMTGTPPKPSSKFASALEFLESLPPGPRAFKTWGEYEEHLQQERKTWDR